MATRRYVSIILAALAGVAALLIFSWFSSCQGRMQACYASFREASSDTDPAQQERQRAIYGGFGASQSMVAFPMPLGDGTNGIVLIDRSNGKPSLIAPINYTHWSPNFSVNGERLLFARQRKGSVERELVTCKVNTWQCEVLFRANSAISSAVDIDEDTAIFAMNVPRSDEKETSRRFDLFVARKGRSLKRLTEYESLTISSISVGGNKIAFAAEGGHGLEPNRCAGSDRFKCDESNIYVRDIVRPEVALPNNPSTLKSHLVVSGYSVGVALSSDGSKVALRNTARSGNPWRYNVIIASLDGTEDREMKVEGFAFSAGAFVGDTFLVNELFDDRYQVRALNISTGHLEDLQFEILPGMPATLPSISLSFSQG
ncbi:MAG: hypothetical protein O9288_16445 [Novosphingobium sp.]|jgi:hypothetical protein|uniref:hypothetical protein n=1 Tax=Novosphingobium sp. TaxID=1874826 RepID=UPI0022BF0226|nr:hypothetical protein [Novosphingobium sp.]MCZ8036335.1 hypothetical protein [Novosphingobium sp.]